MISELRNEPMLTKALHLTNESTTVVSRRADEDPEGLTETLQPARSFPMELFLEVVEHSKALGLEHMRVLSQVCCLARKIALPHAYSTVSRNWNFEHLVRLPEHLRPFLQNAWIEDLRTPPQNVLAESWFCQTATNISMPIWTFFASLFMAMPDIADPNPLRLTLHPSWHRFRYCDMQARVNTIVDETSYANRITHIRFHVDPEAIPFLLQVMEQLPCLTHVALRFEKHEYWALSVVDAGVALLELTTAKVLLISEPPSSSSAFMLKARDMMIYNERFYLVTGALSVQGMLEEWEDVLLHREEDIWTKAEKVREAVVAEDEEEVKRICGVVREG